MHVLGEIWIRAGLAEEVQSREEQGGEDGVPWGQVSMGILPSV